MGADSAPAGFSEVFYRLKAPTDRVEPSFARLAIASVLDKQSVKNEREGSREQGGRPRVRSSSLTAEVLKQGLEIRPHQVSGNSS